MCARVVVIVVVVAVVVCNSCVVATGAVVMVTVVGKGVLDGRTTSELEYSMIDDLSCWSWSCVVDVGLDVVGVV